MMRIICLLWPFVRMPACVAAEHGQRHDTGNKATLGPGLRYKWVYCERQKKKKKKKQSEDR